MTAAYAAFANHGLVPQPLFVRRVEDRDGSVLYEAHESSTRAVSDTTAFLMSIDAGGRRSTPAPATRARQLGFTLPAAGKTGTTNDFNDAWFVGYTPTLVAGVWVGFDQPHTILPNGFAADVAVPVWAKFMKAATRGDKPEWFTPPAGVTTANVCRLSGKLATDGCQQVDVVDEDGQLERRSMVYTEYFARGHRAHCLLRSAPDARRSSPKSPACFGGGDDRPLPPHVDAAALPPPSAAPAAQAAVGSAGQAERRRRPQKKKKRGFWSKLFGIGKDEAPDDNADQAKPPKKKGGE